MAGFRQFVSDQYTTLPIVPTVSDCMGKTFIVTGANTGLGFECAKHLVRLSSSRVILAVRSLKKGEEAKSKIEAETGNKGIAEVWTLDLSSYDSVKTFAKKIQSLDRLDSIIENAGVALAEWSTAEGLETTLTVNVTSTFLLAALVLPKLKETAKKIGQHTRLTVIGSEVAFHVPGELEKIKDGDILENMSIDSKAMSTRYQASKLLELYALRHFASLHPVSSTGVIMNYVNPGFCYSDLARNATLLFAFQMRIMRLFLARSTEVGSRNLIYGAVAPEESHGKFLSCCSIKEDYVPEWITNDSGKQIQQRVWDSLKKQLNSIEPGCL